MPSAQQDSEGSKLERGPRAWAWVGGGCAPSHLTQSPSRPLSVANSVASYENEGASGPPEPWAGRLGLARTVLTPCPSPEPACEDEDDEEEDYHNEGYL